MKKVYFFGFAAVLLIITSITVWSGGGSQPSAAGAGTNFNPTGMPIVNTPVELTALTVRHANMGESFINNTWMVELERRSNVRINWQVFSSVGWEERKAILLASGNLPDIIIGSIVFNDTDIMGNLDMFLPLDDLINQHMPRYRAAMQAIPALRSIATFPDGRMYSMSRNLPNWSTVANQPIINGTWLDRLGLGIPSNLDEFVAVLRAFRDNDANGNGNPNDEFPISFTGERIPAGLLEPFGITNSSASQMSIIDGRVFHWPSSPEYRDAIRWVRQLWVEGLIDPESYTQSSAMLLGKHQNPEAPQVGVAWAWTPLSGTFGQWGFQNIAIPPIAGPTGRRYASGDHNGFLSIMRNEALITIFCSMPEVAARYLDEWYESEASIQNLWGPIGISITKHDDGTYSLNSPPPGMSASDMYWGNSLRDFGPKFIEPGFSDRIRLDPTSGDGLKMEIARMAEAYVMEPFPNIIFSPREMEELAALTVDLNSLINQTQARWVTQGGIDNEWDNYIRQLNAIGLQRYIAILMDGYNRLPRR